MKYVMVCTGCGSDKDFVGFGTCMDYLVCNCGEQMYIDEGELVKEDSDE